MNIDFKIIRTIRLAILNMTRAMDDAFNDGDYDGYELYEREIAIKEADLDSHINAYDSVFHDGAGSDHSLC